ncbi:MAG: hypothetical protein CVU56_25845, partial [Deltaproteobacteria bacterium HGW-Deltaproteobacteria-14]
RDRRALAALAAALPAHGVPAAAPPADDADDVAWTALARRLLEVFAPRSLRAARRDALVARTRPLAPAIAAMVPRHRRYLALQRALVDAARGAEHAPVIVPRTPYTIRVGVTAPEVALLRERLLLEGYGDPNVTGRLRTYFDPRLKRALWAWEKDHGLPVTVVLDPLTRQRLNAPLPSQVAPIALALARWRELDLRDDGGRYVLVHLNDQRLMAETDGVADVAMDVIIGRPTEVDATPAVSAPLIAVVAHPDWRVPRRIVEESLQPRAAGVPEVLMDEGYEVEVTAAGEWRVRLPPGPSNPLGELKFILRGTAGVYLHDTNRRDLFQQPARALSHGCVRVASPRELAAWVLTERRPALAEALDGPALVRFDLDRPLAAHLVYQTLSVAPDGRLLSHRDVYGRDPEALATLDVSGVAEALRDAATPASSSPPAATPPSDAQGSASGLVR